MKPDLVALALTVGAVLALERRRPGLAAALLVLAAATKPTAIVPAIALLGWILWRDRALLRGFVLGSEQRFSAKTTFNAVFGQPVQPFLGGGAQLEHGPELTELT